LVVDRKPTDQAVPANTDEVLKVAGELATECLAPRAARYDAEATYPKESWQDVWQHGLLAIRDFAKTQTFAPDPSPIAESLVVQRIVAEMSLELDGARRVLHPSAAEWAAANPAERAVLSARAKYLATEATLGVATKAIQVAGGRSAHKGMPLERLYRDVRTSTLMPPNLERCLEIVGRSELGLDTSLYRDA
jgi:alkylation response protein AidB-like acyl-CoA dehydrogenase